MVIAVEAPLSDTALYFQYAAMAVDRGMTPYEGSFAIEYPPLAWWTIVTPRLLDSRRVTAARGPGDLWPLYPTYRRNFRALMLACDIVAFGLLLAIASRTGPEAAGWAALGYVAATTPLWGVLLDRLDAGLLLLLLLWAWCWQRSLDEARRTIAWSAAAWAALGTSISFKLIPIVCVPLLLLAEWRDVRRSARLAVALPALAAGALLPFAVQLAISGRAAFALFGRHAGRGVQLESLYGTIMVAASWLGWPVAIVHADGGFNVEGTLGPLLKSVATGALVALVGATSWWTWRWARDRRDAGRAACFSVVAAVALSNVLSPQYLVWALPLAVLIGLDTLRARPTARWLLLALITLIAALTTWLFPYHYFVGSVEPSSPYGIVPLPLDGPLAPSSVGYLVLAARNALYGGMVVWLARLSFRRPSGRPAA